MILEYIEKSCSLHNVTTICALLGVSTSGDTAWRERSISQQRQYDMRLMNIIKALHQGYRRAYGAGPNALRIKEAEAIVAAVEVLIV